MFLLAYLVWLRRTELADAGTRRAAWVVLTWLFVFWAWLIIMTVQVVTAAPDEQRKCAKELGHCQLIGPPSDLNDEKHTSWIDLGDDSVSRQ